MSRGAYGARHSMPLQSHITIPRQYIGPDGRVLLPGNSARNAISEEFARAAILTGERRAPQAAKPEGRVCTSCQPEARPRPVTLLDETELVQPRAGQTRSGDKA